MFVHGACNANTSSCLFHYILCQIILRWIWWNGKHHLRYNFSHRLHKSAENLSSFHVYKKEKLQCLFYDLSYILLPTFCVIDWHDGGLYIQMELSNLQKVKNLSISMKFKFKVQPTMSIQGLLQPFFIVYELSVSVHMARTLDNDNSVFAIPCTRGCVTQPLDIITN